MRCGVCGANNADGSKFCWNCGNKLAENPDTETVGFNSTGAQENDRTTPTGAQQNYGNRQQNPTGAQSSPGNRPQGSVRPPQRQVPPGSFDWKNGKKMAEERFQKGKDIADGYVERLKKAAEKQTVTDKLKKISKKTWGIIGACAAAVVVLLLVIALHKPTIDLNDYLTITYDGYDGGGTAYTVIDWDGMTIDYGQKLSYKKGVEKNSNLTGVIGSMSPVDVIREYTEVTIDSYNEKLSNGDNVSYAWTVNKDAIQKLLKCRITFGNGTETVSGLKEMELFDPFKDLEVTFTGVDPDGEVNIEYKGDLLSMDDFTCDKWCDLKNGDKITISLTEDADYYVDRYEKAPSVTEKEYEVKSLGKYLSKIEEINADGTNSIQAKAQKQISDMVGNWSEVVTLDSVSYVGDYLQVAKDSEDYYKNYYGLIYQINAHIQVDGGPRTDVVSYYNVEFSNLIIAGDGNCEVDLDAYNVPYDDFRVDAIDGESYSHTFWFDGYQTLDELKKNYVDESSDDYNCEWNVSGDVQTVDLGVTSDYLCPYISARLLTASDVEGYLNTDYSQYNFPGDRDIIQMIINELFAKDGYEFTDPELSAYFSTKTWYTSNTNKVNNMDAVSATMSEIEKKNIDFLNSYR